MAIPGSSKAHHIFINVIFIVIGSILLLAEYISFFNTQGLLYVIGGGLLVGGGRKIAETWIYTARWEYDRVEGIVDEWGLKDIQSGRGRAEEKQYKGHLNNCREKLHIQAITLTRFRHDMGEILEEKAKAGVEIRILLMDPESELCSWYEKVAPGRSGLEEQIRTSAEYYNNLDARDLEVRYYQGLPNNYFRMDDEAFIGPYFIHNPGRSTVTLLGDVNRGIGEQYKENFEELWNHSRPS